MRRSPDLLAGLRLRRAACGLRQGAHDGATGETDDATAGTGTDEEGNPITLDRNPALYGLGVAPRALSDASRRELQRMQTYIGTRTLADVRQQITDQLAYERMPSLLKPKTGRLGLQDHEKVFCVDHKGVGDIFDMRGIDRKNGVIHVIDTVILPPKS